MEMTIVDYCVYALLGMIVVFLALIFLMIVIKVMTIERKKPVAAGVEGGIVNVSASAPKLAPGTAGELKLYDTDPRDAAMIMAIVADELKKPLNELRFISIRELK